MTKLNGEKITVWLKFISKALDKLANIIDFVRTQFSDLQVPGQKPGSSSEKK